MVRSDDELKDMDAAPNGDYYSDKSGSEDEQNAFQQEGAKAQYNDESASDAGDHEAPSDDVTPHQESGPR